MLRLCKFLVTIGLFALCTTDPGFAQDQFVQAFPDIWRASGRGYTYVGKQAPENYRQIRRLYMDAVLDLPLSAGSVADELSEAIHLIRDAESTNTSLVDVRDEVRRLIPPDWENGKSKKESLLLSAINDTYLHPRRDSLPLWRDQFELAYAVVTLNGPRVDYAFEQVVALDGSGDVEASVVLVLYFSIRLEPVAVSTTLQPRLVEPSFELRPLLEEGRPSPPEDAEIVVFDELREVTGGEAGDIIQIGTAYLDAMSTVKTHFADSSLSPELQGEVARYVNDRLVPKLYAPEMQGVEDMFARGGTGALRSHLAMDFATVPLHGAAIKYRFSSYFNLTEDLEKNKPGSMRLYEGATAYVYFDMSTAPLAGLIDVRAELFHQWWND